MKKMMFTAAAATMFAAPAAAWEGQKVACYDKHWVPATYTTTKHLEYESKHKWEHVDGQMVKMYYPPVYMEKTHLKEKGHYVLRKAPCN
jgi:heat shock protein HslJ